MGHAPVHVPIETSVALCLLSSVWELQHRLLFELSLHDPHELTKEASALEHPCILGPSLCAHECECVTLGLPTPLPRVLVSSLVK